MQSSIPTRPWTTWGMAWGLGILLVLAVGIVLPGTIMIILKMTGVATIGQLTHGWAWAASSAESELAFGFSGGLAWWIAARQRRFGGNWRWGLWLKGLVGGGFLGAGVSAVGVAVQHWTGHPLPTDSQYLMTPAGIHNGPFLAMLIVVALIAPMMEEWFFRGTLQTSLAGAIGSGWAVGIVAVLFALLHELDAGHPLAHPWLWVPILPLGIVLGMVRARTDRMSGNIGIHMGFNLWAAVLMAMQFWH